MLWKSWENNGITGDALHLQNAVWKQTFLVNYCNYIFKWLSIGAEQMANSGKGAFSLVKLLPIWKGSCFFPKECWR